MTKTIIKLIEVYQIYKMGEVEVRALNGLNLEVKEKEFIAIMGPSGSGKSTAVNLIGCLDLPTKGVVYLEGKDISKLTESDLAKIRGQIIGFVFQRFNLIHTLSAMENVMLPMMFQDIPEEKRIKRAKELLEMVDLGDRMHHKPLEMSGGEQQRVAIARALANDPDVIIADEPTGNLDSKTGEQVVELIEKLHREKGKTIIMVTHDEKLSKRAQRIERLMDGRIIKTQKNR
ncbi:ABC transporter ATP-binding protein [Candidatus Woesearchaeota archaeon]|nr:ABC transporter ATP-binding protein [Candidatus Woesearchaeota archaeon]